MPVPDIIFSVIRFVKFIFVLTFSTVTGFIRRKESAKKKQKSSEAATPAA